MGTRLEGRTALVTGATSNIGRAIAIAFGAEGAHVVVSGRSVERGAEVVDQITAGGGRAEFVAADLNGSSLRPPSWPTRRHECWVVGSTYW